MKQWPGKAFAFAHAAAAAAHWPASRLSDVHVLFARVPMQAVSQAHPVADGTRGCCEGHCQEERCGGDRRGARRHHSQRRGRAHLNAVVRPLRRPEREANLRAQHPPVGVPLDRLAMSGLVVGDHVAAILGEERPREVPPLANLGLGEGVAPRRQQLQRRRIVCLLVSLLLPRCERQHCLVLNGLGLGTHVLVDEGKVQIRVLVDQVVRPPRDLCAELRHAALMAVEALRSASRGGPEEGQVRGAVRRVVAEPCDAPTPRPGLQHVGPGGAVHGDGALPLAADALGCLRAAVRAPEGPRRHALRQVVRRPLVVVTQHVHDLARCDGALRCRDRTRVGILRLRQVSLLRIELGSLQGAEQAEDAPHAAATVVAQGVCEGLRSNGVARLGVRLEAVRAEEVEDAGLVLAGAPPTHLLGELRDSGAVQEVCGVAQVHLADREGVADGNDVPGRHAHGRPDRARITPARHDVEDPKLAGRGIRDSQRFSAVREVGVARFTAVRTVEPKLDGHGAHCFHSAPGRLATFHGDLGQVLDASLVVAVRPVWCGRPAHCPSRARALANGEASLVLHTVIHVPIRECLGNLWDVRKC
mmetsp:Transcript_91102/g.253665  ORF Transcript_91102/g.253665 Transcript_91102/m.253665 type:complete len:587 (-) Transcript_91102:368-2128(-)